MSLYVTGDTHDVISRFGFKHRNLTKDDIVIILGILDTWNKYPRHDVPQKWLAKVDYCSSVATMTIQICCGKCQEKKQFGGEVRRLQVGDYIADHIFVVDVPTILTLENQKCLCSGCEFMIFGRYITPPFRHEYY